MPSVVPPSQPPSAEPSSAPAVGRIVFTRWRTLASGEEVCASRLEVLLPSQRSHLKRRWLRRAGALPGTALARPGRLTRRYQADRQRRRLGRRPHLPHGRRWVPARCSTPTASRPVCRLGLQLLGGRLPPCIQHARSGEPGPSGGPCRRNHGHGEGYGRGARIDPRRLGLPGWSPDGARVVFGNHVVDADDSNLQEIAPADLFADEEFGVFSAGFAPPQWSIDGSLIAFTSFNDTFPTNPPERNSQGAWTSTLSGRTERA